VKFIIKKNAFRSLNYHDEDGNNPLHIAACFGTNSIIRTILDNGAPIDKKNYDGNTPLHLANIFKKVSAVDTLIERGAN
jgi:ankyrin repeat protein